MGYPFRARFEHDPTGDVTVIQMKDIDDTNTLRLDSANKVSQAAKQSRHMLRAGDLVFRSRGRSNGAALVGEGIGHAVLAAPMLLIRPLDILPAYLYWFINAPPAVAQLASLAAGTAVQMISAEALKSLEIPVPTLERQHQIVALATLAKAEQQLQMTLASERHRLVTHILTRYARASTP